MQSWKSHYQLQDAAGTWEGLVPQVSLLKAMAGPTTVHSFSPRDALCPAVQGWAWSHSLAAHMQRDSSSQLGLTHTWLGLPLTDFSVPIPITSVRHEMLPRNFSC